MKTLCDYQHHLIEARLESTSTKPSVGLGLVLWREDGCCVGAATKACKGSDDVAKAEAMGLREALLLVDSK
ncbi:hypothetical protein A2U01_0011512 [Trifolium medium]|uniref:RNase H type-1 domain-containing protein n=1 Tax=Trifolium medium TaxID=97028 RepID=A0A392MU95_9FABA|nr:hypothetical protein [Trifolium medium]